MRFWAFRATFILGLISIPSAASTFSFSNSFPTDDSMFTVLFNLGTASTVTLESYSYGGGVDPLNGAIAAGEFAPVLSLFDPAGNLLTFDDGGVAPFGCGPRGIESDNRFLPGPVSSGNAFVRHLYSRSYGVR